jgi:phospholipid transport system substrate-binding protein
MASMRKLGRSPALVSVLAAFIVAMSLAIQVKADTDAGEFLISFGKHAAKELNDESLSKPEQEARFRELFNEAVDVPVIGRFILGRHWRTATDQEREGFLDAFQDVAVQRFLPMFTRKSDEIRGKGFNVVDIRSADRGKGQIFVQTEVLRESRPPARLTWRIREIDGRFKIIDLSVAGVSMVLTLREEYGSVIRQTGSVGGLVDLMREKLQSRAYAPKEWGEGQ